MYRISSYIHLPFCRKRCLYCDFFSTETTTIPVQRYLHALSREWRYRTSYSDEFELLSAYIGGGTPSLLSGDDISRLLSILPLENVEEVTVECNPGDATKEWFSSLVAGGADRFSIGVQALDDARLRFLGRRHDSAAARRSIAAAQSSGARSLGADIIYGTPEQTPDGLAKELDELARLGVDHVSCYELTVGRETPLGRQVASGDVRLPGEDEMVRLWQTAYEVLVSYNFERYEISNFSLPGHRCRHNEHYWAGGLYIGLGLGAHGFVETPNKERMRYANQGSLESYLADADAVAPKDPSSPANGCDAFSIRGLGSSGFQEVISDLDYARERLMLGFRTSRGAPFDSITAALSEKEKLRFKAIAGRLEQLKMVKFIEGYLVSTETGLLRADALAEEFF